MTRPLLATVMLAMAGTCLARTAAPASSPATAPANPPTTAPIAPPATAPATPAATAPATTTTAAAMIANPQYESWKNHKPGTWVKLDAAQEVMGQKMTMHLQFTLMELTPQKATVEVTSTIETMGRTQETPKRLIEVPATVQAGQDNLPAGFDGKRTDLPNETIEMNGRKYDCRVIQFEGHGDDMDITGKIWATPEVPGGIVKREMSGTSGDKSMQDTMTLVEISAK